MSWTAVMTRPIPPPSLEELAVRARGGEADCFDELARRLREPLTRFIRRRLDGGVDAEDVVQETLLRAYRGLDGYDPSRRFTTWLYAIGKNVAADHRDLARRRQERERQAPIAAEALAAADVPDVWRAARRALGDDAYRALWLRYGQDLSVAEVAREIGRSVVATKVMLFRARRKLIEVAR